MKSITVFTPSFNRAHLLPRLYESLKNQTSKDFVWMIIDDGSVDNTKSLVEHWIKESNFEIQYHYKKNGGMHTAHNLAYSLIETELNVCIDSDDQMPQNAIERIIGIWNKEKYKTKLAGIIGLDTDLEGNVLGTPIPKDLKKGNLKDLYKKYGVTGDKKLVLRSDLTKQYPTYPEYEKEKLVPLGILYLMIGNDYDFVYSNEVLCLVDYQEGGSSNTIQKQYFQSPRGFAYAKQVQKKYTRNAKEQITYSIHIGISSLIAKDFSLMKQGPKVVLNWLFLPLAYLGVVYLKWKTK